MKELGELWRELEEFGRVSMMTFLDGEYSATLKLHNVTRGLQSTFDSGYRHKTPGSALTTLLGMVREAQEKINADH